MPKALYFLSGGLIAIGLVGTGLLEFLDRMLGDISPIGRYVVTWIQDFDFWLIENRLSPSFITAGVVLAVLTASVPIAYDRLFGFYKSRKEFEVSFQDFQNRRARTELAWSLAAAYRKIKHDQELSTFKLHLDRLEFPENFPPKKDVEIGEYANTAREQLNNDGQVLWDFCSEVFEYMFEPERQALMRQAQYRALLSGIRTTGAFWDDWARKIFSGELRAKDVRGQVGANIRGIKLLALAELVIAKNFSWDTGSGRSCLFMLAKLKFPEEYDRLAERSWRKSKWTEIN